MSNSRRIKGIGTIRGGVALALFGVLAMSYASDEIAPAAQPQPRHAPGVLIVKFKEPVADELKAALVRGEPLHQVSTTASLDALNAKYGLQRMGMVFDALQVRDADGVVVRINSMEEHVAGAKKNLSRKIHAAPEVAKLPDLTRVFKVELEESIGVEAAALEYRRDPSVEWAQPDYMSEAHWHPNDYFYNYYDQHGIGSWGQPYDDLWGIKRINCESAWDTSRGSGAVIAVVDTGLYIDVQEYPGSNPPWYVSGHQDIVPGNVWYNYDELYGHTGYDDDHNGKVDDIVGWDFVDDDNNPKDSDGHGTHVAGTAAAIGNNTIGVIGVAPEARIMVVRVSFPLAASEAAEAIEYATYNGADVVNCSWGGPQGSEVVHDAIKCATIYYDSVVVCAAGKYGRPLGYPARFNEAMAVAAVDYDDERTWYSDWGIGLDLAAPGGDSDALDLLSTRSDPTAIPETLWVSDPNSGDIYARGAGTSMAAPHVSGTAALIRSLHPGYHNQEVRGAIRFTAVDKGQYGHDALYGAGRLDAAGAVAREDPCAALITEPQDGHVFYRVYNPPDNYPEDRIEVRGVAFGNEFGQWKVEYKLQECGSWQLLSQGYDPKPWWEPGLFGTIYLDGVPDGQYLIRLSVQGYTSYGYYEHYVSALVVTSTHSVGYRMDTTPLVAEIDAAYPGKEVVFGLLGHWHYFYPPGEWRWDPGPVRAIHNDGSVYWNYYWAEGHRGSPAGTLSSPVSAELLDDPEHPGPEIVIGCEDPLESIPLYVLHSDGTLAWNFASESFLGIRSSPAVDEIVADPEHPGAEIAAGHRGTYQRVYCIHADGVEAWRYQGSLGVENSSATVDDIDPTNPGKEIAIGSGYPFRLYVLKSNGQLHRSVDLPRNGGIACSPAVADILPQYPGNEIVFGCDDGYVYAYSCAANQMCWEYDTGGPIWSSPAIGDLDPDYDGLEIAVGSNAAKVVCLRANGALAWEFNTGEPVEYCSPAIANIDPSNDWGTTAVPEVIIGAKNGRFWALGGYGGYVRWGFATNPDLWVFEDICSPVVADIRSDLDGLEMVIAPDDGYVYIFHFPGTQGGSEDPWPMMQGNSQHTGYYDQ